MRARATLPRILICVGVLFMSALPAQSERAIRYLLFMTGPSEGFSPHRPERITPEAFRELVEEYSFANVRQRLGR